MALVFVFGQFGAQRIKIHNRFLSRLVLEKFRGEIILLNFRLFFFGRQGYFVFELNNIIVVIEVCCHCFAQVQV